MYASIRFFKTSLISAIMALSAYSLSAQATLTSYTANEVDLVYSSVSDVTWTKDANLLGSLFANQGYNTVVNNILAVSPTITNTPSYFSPNGIYSLSTSDFFSNGTVTWFGAMAFINYLNNINYAGSNHWRLPTFVPPFYVWDNGYNIPSNGKTPGNELSELFYQELKGVARSSFPSTTSFDNKQPENYWSGTESTSVGAPANAWSFSNDGWRVSASKNNRFYVWAVNEQISAVPAPAAAWLFATGLPIIAVAKRSRSKCA